MRLLKMFPVLVGIVLGAGAAAAQDGAPATVPNAPLRITIPPAGKVDNLFATAPVPGGFMVTWARSTGSIPPFIVQAQKFTTTGRPASRAVIVDGPGTVGDVAVPRVLKDGKLGLFWLRNGHVWAARLDPATMAITLRTDLGKSDDHIHDATVLANGNIALITAQIDLSNPNDVRYIDKIKVVTPAFRTVRDWTSIHGRGYKIDGWAYLDQAIVGHSAGGLALWRDHATSNIFGRNFNGLGVPSATAVRLNTTTMSATSIVDLAFFRVKAVRLTSGRLAVCWVSLEAGGGDRYEVRCRIASATGQPIGRDFLAHKATAGGQTQPDVVALPGDRFMVSWVHADVLFPAFVRYRAFDSAGRPLYAERVGHAFTASDLSLAPLSTSASLLGDGSVAVVMDQSAFTTGLRAFGIASPSK